MKANEQITTSAQGRMAMPLPSLWHCISSKSNGSENMSQAATLVLRLPRTTQRAHALLVASRVLSALQSHRISMTASEGGTCGWLEVAAALATPVPRARALTIFGGCARKQSIVSSPRRIRLSVTYTLDHPSQTLVVWSSISC